MIEVGRECIGWHISMVESNGIVLVAELGMNFERQLDESWSLVLLYSLYYVVMECQTAQH